MKTNNILLVLFFFSIILNFAQGNKVSALKAEIEKAPKVVLPEEYKALTQDDNIYGWYANDTLYIDFDNQAYYKDILN